MEERQRSKRRKAERMREREREGEINDTMNILVCRKVDSFVNVSLNRREVRRLRVVHFTFPDRTLAGNVLKILPQLGNYNGIPILSSATYLPVYCMSTQLRYSGASSACMECRNYPKLPRGRGWFKLLFCAFSGQEC